ncbi:MAG: zf-HC2 domain-containing protein [Planctomycetes bacterium]|nr:zf-HC2 domain-containing protein [Planctomycetota bacterium]MBL7007430.1 zf-HC2 domain-containing protein [Planctomycetota bacterium]
MHACHTWARRVGAWFDDEVSELESVEVRAHLMECPGCRAAVAQWRSLHGELQLLQPAAASAEAVARMSFRFEEGLAGEVHELSRGLRSWTLAAALMLAVGLGLLVVGQRTLPRDVAANDQRDIDRAVREILQRPAPAAPAPTDQRE